MSVSPCSRAAMATLRCAGRSSTVDACVLRSAARQVHDGHTEPEDLKGSTRRPQLAQMDMMLTSNWGASAGGRRLRHHEGTCTRIQDRLLFL